MAAVRRCRVGAESKMPDEYISSCTGGIWSIVNSKLKLHQWHWGWQWYKLWGQWCQFIGTNKCTCDHQIKKPNPDL